MLLVSSRLIAKYGYFPALAAQFNATEPLKAVAVLGASLIELFHVSARQLFPQCVVCDPGGVTFFNSNTVPPPGSNRNPFAVAPGWISAILLKMVPPPGPGSSL